MTQEQNNTGFTLVETMVAAAIAGIALIGTMGAVEFASKLITKARLIDNGSEVAQSRLEIKRSLMWRRILEDDLDRDGVPETEMNDKGEGADVLAGDGVYTAAAEVNGTTEVWTIHVDLPGPLASVGLVVITSTVTYTGPDGIRNMRMDTLRANPVYLGPKQT